FTIFLLIHKDHCEGCKEALPAYTEAALHARASNVRAYTINQKRCSEDFFNDYAVEYFPTVLRLGPKGYEHYKGPRTAAGYMEFMGVMRNMGVGEDQRSDMTWSGKKRGK